MPCREKIFILRSPEPYECVTLYGKRDLADVKNLVMERLPWIIHSVLTEVLIRNKQEVQHQKVRFEDTAFEAAGLASGENTSQGTQTASGEWNRQVTHNAGASEGTRPHGHLRGSPVTM